MTKNKLNFKAHPLTILFGCVYVLLGQGMETVVYLAVVLAHEFTHYAFAVFCGVPMEELTVTPFGGCLKGELMGIPKRETLIITLSAPIINLLFAALIFALWWLVPALYPYTETVAYANLSIGLINSAPCYPLDGGRAFIAAFNGKAAEKAVFIFTLIAAAGLLGAFVASIFYSFNLSYLMMSVFLFWGAFYSSKKDKTDRRLKRLFYKSGDAQIVRYISVKKDIEQYKLLGMIEDGFYTFFVEIEKGKMISVISEDEIILNIKR